MTALAINEDVAVIDLVARVNEVLPLWCPHAPTEKQAEFLFSPEREILYGGAAGGGKSDALLMAALLYVDVPSYSAILFRRTYADLGLEGALIPRSKEWLSATPATWNEQRKQWRFPSGATLQFAYLETDQDAYRYQSAEFQFIGFDELTQFSDFRYRYLFSRLRRADDMRHVPLRMRAASNPGGVGHHWVKHRLVESTDPERLFVSARMDDNPHLDLDAYRESLAQLDPVTRAQLEHGDWSIQPEGEKFKRAWFKFVDKAPEKLKKVARYWDLAATEPGPGEDPDWTAGVKMGVDEAGMFYILHARRFRRSPMGVEKAIRETAEEDGRNVEIFMEQEPGSSGVNTIDHYARRVLAGFSFHGNRATGPKELRANPLSAAAENGLVSIVSGAWVSEFIDELCAFPQGAHDDQVDAASGAHEKIATKRKAFIA